MYIISLNHFAHNGPASVAIATITNLRAVQIVIILNLELKERERERQRADGAWTRDGLRLKHGAAVADAITLYKPTFPAYRPLSAAFATCTTVRLARTAAHSSTSYMIITRRG